MLCSKAPVSLHRAGPVSKGVCCTSSSRIAKPSARPPASLVCCASKQGAAVPAKVAAGAAALSLLLSPGGASASVEQVGEFDVSGFLFKDQVEVTAYDDPLVQGVTLYLSEFRRSLTDKLAKDFFSEPSQAGLTCEVNGPVLIKDPSQLGGKSGAEVFSESKGFNLFKNKTLRLRRVFDPKRNSLVYIAYSTRLTGAQDEGTVSSGRYRTSLCAIKLPDAAPAPQASP